MSKRTKERPLESVTSTPSSRADELKRLSIIKWLRDTTKNRIAEIMKNLEYANPDGWEYKYLIADLRNEQHFLNQLSNGKQNMPSAFRGRETWMHDSREDWFADTDD